ncbi:GIY-YIG nuclease family protein [Patescibacteria group bacterium]|nr:GIY-YIG nuclease family protein [Patescibacteria group bacterium]
MFYVYIIKSEQDGRFYVGFSTELKGRIKAHNFGQSIHTAKYKPWKLICYLAFEDIDTAKQFEKYLKSHSGRIFLKKRLIK